MKEIFNAPNLNYLWAKLLVEELVRNGVDYFCIAPGSRSSAVTVAVAQNKRARSFIHFDERGLAFHALGHAAAKGKPCALITTSGTAVANLFPAVIEASKKKVPLIILSADRPAELRQTGAHQTIDQVKIFGNYVRWFVDLPCPTTEIAPAYVLTTVDQAVYQATSELKGPVHLNCPFREPLAPVKEKGGFSSYLTNLRTWEASAKPYTQYAAPRLEVKKEQLKNVAACLNKAKQGIIVVGKLGSAADQKSVVKIAEHLNWPVFADLTSGLRLSQQSSNVIHYFDQILLSKKVRALIKPDCVLHLGGRITSKRWYQFVEEARPAHYVTILNHSLRNDPLNTVTHRVQATAGAFVKAALPALKPGTPKTALKTLQKLNTLVGRELDALSTENAHLNEVTTARAISTQIKKGSALFLASSLSVRLIDFYADTKGEVPLGSNRGASGIDGTIATAAGFSKGFNKPVTLLIGDLAALHDLNSLAMLKSLKQPMTIVVLNNDGGGIFSLLPISEFKGVFDQYFGTPHGLGFEHAAKMFGLNYRLADGSKKPNATGGAGGFEKLYTEAQKSGKSTLIEVRTDRDEFKQWHKYFQLQLVKKLNKMVS